MAAASQASETLTLAPQQLSNWLWSDPSQQVYAVAMGARLPQLASRLAQAYAAALVVLPSISAAAGISRLPPDLPRVVSAAPLARAAVAARVAPVWSCGLSEGW